MKNKKDMITMYFMVNTLSNLEYFVTNWLVVNDANQIWIGNVLFSCFIAHENEIIKMISFQELIHFLINYFLY